MAVAKNGELSRKDRERERHRLEILAAAERVFVRKGYLGTTVEDIAREAEFAVGTLYNFFAGKEELYAEVVTRTAREFIESFESVVLSKEDPEEAVGSLIELRLTHFEEHRGFFRVLIDAFPGGRLAPPPGLPTGLTELYDRYVETVNGLFERGVRNGSFQEMDPLYLTLCLEGIMNAFVMYWSRHEPTEPLSVRVQKMRDGFLGGIRARGRGAEPLAHEAGTDA
jgi:TetR/AcrR family transcriptional regulator